MTAPIHLPIPDVVAAGHAWAERQHAAGAPDEWLATWREAVALGLAPDDARHELAGLCAAAARSHWRELRPNAPRTATSPTRKSRSGTSRTDEERLARSGVIRKSVLLPPDLVARIEALGPFATVVRKALETAFPATKSKK